VRKSNRTDNDRAKMATSKGVILGTGAAGAHRRGVAAAARRHHTDHRRFGLPERSASPRAPCRRTPDTTPVRTLAFFHGRSDTDGLTHTARLPARIDAPAGREAYGQRFATVEPVFGHGRANKRLDRFTRCGRTKVNG